MKEWTCLREEKNTEIWNFSLNPDEQVACCLSLYQHFYEEKKKLIASGTWDYSLTKKQSYFYD